MTLLARLKNQHTTQNVRGASVTRADLMVAQGYTLRHVYGIGDRCPMCEGRLQREEWGQRFTPTVGLNVCTCGFVSQVGCIA